MANIVQMPVAVNLPWYTFSTTLEQVGYRFEMAYNTRAARWSLTVSNAAGEVLAASLPLLIDRDVLKNVQGQGVPPGQLICVDTTGNQAQPTLGSFLTTHAMYYVESGA